MSQANTVSTLEHGEALAADVSEQLAECCAEQQEDFGLLMEQVGTAVTDYCKRQPNMAALAVFALGFIVGWKIKPW